MEFYLFYVTAKDVDEARLIAKSVVEERLAACANIFGGIQSVYRWDGKVCEDHEAALILKTTHERKPELLQRIRELHSYEVPCIVCMPIVDGNPDFLSWVGTETAK